MMKNRVRKRIPFFTVKGVPVPQLPQRHASWVRPTFQQKKCVPMISILTSCRALARALPFLKFRRTHSGNLNQVTETYGIDRFVVFFANVYQRGRNLKSISKGIAAQSDWLVPDQESDIFSRAFRLTRQRDPFT